MDTLFNNKTFIKLATVFVGILSLFLIVLGINKIKEGRTFGSQMATINVSGTGEVTAVADIANLSFSISKDGKTSKEAQDELNTTLTKVLAYIKDQKIEDKDVKSEYGGVMPKYASMPVCYNYPCPNNDAKIVGYTATQSIVIKVRLVDSANDIRTGISTLGITNISGPDFSIDDEDALKDQARAKAITDAQEKAKVLAKQLGVRLGKVISFSDNGSNTPYPTMYSAGAMMKADMASAPVLPKGENKIISNISIIYEIR